MLAFELHISRETIFCRDLIFNKTNITNVVHQLEGILKNTLSQMGVLGRTKQMPRKENKKNKNE